MAREIQGATVSVFLGFCFVVFAFVSTTIFQTFNCASFGDDPNRYLALDTTINCDDESHKIWESYASIMIGVYPVGITLMFFIMLFRKRHILQDETLRTTDGAAAVSELCTNMRERESERSKRTRSFCCNPLTPLSRLLL